MVVTSAVTNRFHHSRVAHWNGKPAGLTIQAAALRMRIKGTMINYDSLLSGRRASVDAFASVALPSATPLFDSPIFCAGQTAPARHFA
jgi:hypothetical protein